MIKPHNSRLQISLLLLSEFKRINQLLFSFLFQGGIGVIGGVLLLVKSQALVCNFTKSKTPLWMFFTFLKLYKWYQIAQRTTLIN